MMITYSWISIHIHILVVNQPWALDTYSLVGEMAWLVEIMRQHARFVALRREQGLFVALRREVSG